jgi:hypothetical protein
MEIPQRYRPLFSKKAFASLAVLRPDATAWIEIRPEHVSGM